MKKLLTFTGVLVGGAVGATAAYFLAPENGETYQKEVYKLAMQLKQKAAETGVQVLDQLIDALDDKNEINDGQKVKYESRKNCH